MYSVTQRRFIIIHQFNVAHRKRLLITVFRCVHKMKTISGNSQQTLTCVVIPHTETRMTLLLLFSFFIYTYLQKNNQQQRLGIGLSVYCSLRHSRTSDFFNIPATSDCVAQTTRARLNVSHAPLVSWSDVQPQTGL